MRRLSLLLVAATSLTLPAAGCVVEVSYPQYSIETGATLTYKPAMDAGYYAAYATGGHWRLDWTCDSMLSGQGCNFDGTITGVNSAITNAVGYDCDAATMVCNQQSITSAASSVSFSLSINPSAAYEYQYITFDTSPGADVRFDLSIDGLHQPALTFWPDHGVQSPSSIPFELTPTAQ